METCLKESCKHSYLQCFLKCLNFSYGFSYFIDLCILFYFWAFLLSLTVKNLPAMQEFSSFQSLSGVQLFVTPWTAARQQSITNSLSLCKLMSIESVTPSNHLILCHPLLLLPSIFPSIRVFSNESVRHIRWPSIAASASASVLPMDIQD